MKIKKLISLLLATIITITSNGNCFAMISDTDSGAESDGSLSDIVVEPINSDHRNWREEVYKLKDDLRKSDARIIDMRAIEARTQDELDRINQMLCQATRERDDARIQADVARADLQEWRDDVLCTECFCFRNPVDEVRSLIRGDINRTPPNSIWRSKRFYKGMVAGIVLVLVILVGGYVYVHYLQLPDRSE